MQYRLHKTDKQNNNIALACIMFSTHSDYSSLFAFDMHTGYVNMLQIIEYSALPETIILFKLISFIPSRFAQSPKDSQFAYFGFSSCNIQ